MAEDKKEVSSRYALSEVPVEYGLVIQDNKQGVALTEKEILVEILNKLDKIEKAVA